MQLLFKIARSINADANTRIRIENDDFALDNWQDQYSITYANETTIIGLNSPSVSNNNLFEIDGTHDVNYTTFGGGNGDEPYLEIFFSDGAAPLIEDGEELILNYNQGASLGQEPEQLTGAFANFGQSDYTVSQGLTLAPNMVIEPDGSQFFVTDGLFIQSRR